MTTRKKKHASITVNPVYDITGSWFAILGFVALVLAIGCVAEAAKIASLQEQLAAKTSGIFVTPPIFTAVVENERKEKPKIHDNCAAALNGLMEQRIGK